MCLTMGLNIPGLLSSDFRPHSVILIYFDAHSPYPTKSFQNVSKFRTISHWVPSETRLLKRLDFHPGEGREIFADS